MWFSPLFHPLRSALGSRRSGLLHPDAPFHRGLPSDSDAVAQHVLLVDDADWKEALVSVHAVWHRGRLSMEKPRALLFDLDGTLIDSFDGIVQIFLEVLGEMGVTGASADDVRPMIGIPLEDCYAAFVPRARVGEAVERYRANYVGRMHDISPAYAGARELLEALRSVGVRTGVVSNKRGAAVREILARKGWTLDVILGEGEGIRAKPEPDLILAACERVGVKPDEAMYVGDSIFDARAALAAGVPFAGLTTGAHAADELDERATGLFSTLAHFSRALGFSSEPNVASTDR